MVSLPWQSLFLHSDSQPHFPFCLSWLIPCSEVWETGVISSRPAGYSSALPTVLPRSVPQRTDAVLDPVTICPTLSYPQVAKPSEASGTTLPTTPCASTPFSTQSHTSSTSLGSFPSRCLELTLFSTSFSMLFAICMSCHYFGTPLTSTYLPWHVSCSLPAPKSLPTSANILEKQKKCLFSRGGPLIIFHLLVTDTKPAGHSSVIGVLEEDRKTLLLRRTFSSLNKTIFFLDHTAYQNVPDSCLVQILHLPAGGTCHSIAGEHFNAVVASQLPLWSRVVQLRTCCVISQPLLSHRHTRQNY